MACKPAVYVSMLVTILRLHLTEDFKVSDNRLLLLMQIVRLELVNLSGLTALILNILKLQLWNAKNKYDNVWTMSANNIYFARNV